MADVDLPFLPEFDEKLRNEDKTATTRSRRYGYVGDFFEAAGRRFQITSIESCPLHWVAENLFREEGFDAPAGFIEVWKRLHPRDGYRPQDEKWVHRFRKVAERA